MAEQSYIDDGADAARRAGDRPALPACPPFREIASGPRYKPPEGHVCAAAGCEIRLMLFPLRHIYRYYHGRNPEHCRDFAFAVVARGDRGVVLDWLARAHAFEKEDRDDAGGEPRAAGAPAGAG